MQRARANKALTLLPNFKIDILSLIIALMEYLQVTSDREVFIAVKGGIDLSVENIIFDIQIFVFYAHSITYIMNITLGVIMYLCLPLFKHSDILPYFSLYHWDRIFDKVINMATVYINNE